MCLILLAVAPSPEVALVLAANRDEEHERPTSPAAFWSDRTGIFGGRDRKSGGTWLGVAPGGRLAALTNVRQPGARRTGKSRGTLPVRYLTTGATPVELAHALEGELEAYPSFNMVLFDPAWGVFFWSEEGAAPVLLAPGVHGLSNARMNAPWPKVERGKAAMREALSLEPEARSQALFSALRDETIAPDASLPSTGVPIEIERLLSPAFIRGPIYGTRCSTVLVVHNDGAVLFEERSFDARGVPSGVVREHLRPT